MERCLRRRNIYIPKGVPNASEVFHFFPQGKSRRGFPNPAKKADLVHELQTPPSLEQTLNPPPLIQEEEFKTNKTLPLG